MTDQVADVARVLGVHLAGVEPGVVAGPLAGPAAVIVAASHAQRRGSVVLVIVLVGAVAAGATPLPREGGAHRKDIVPAEAKVDGGSDDMVDGGSNDVVDGGSNNMLDGGLRRWHGGGFAEVIPGHVPGVVTHMTG